MTVTVQAGMRVAALQALLGERRQVLPLDVPTPDRTSVGGMIAANLSGSRRLGCGTVRDLLIGVRVVGANGDLIRGGGRVVKNVAGYDLCKLYAGSRGWLGVNVEATFKVAALPPAAGAVAIGCDDAGAAESLCAELLGGQTRPTSIDLLGRDAVRHAFSQTAAQQEFRAPLMMLVGYEGASSAVDWQIDQCRAMPRRVLATLDSGSLASVRQRIVDIAYGAAGAHANPASRDAQIGASPRFALRASVLSSAAAGLCADWIALGGEGVLSHVASGIVCGAFGRDAIDAALERVVGVGGSWTFANEGAADRAARPMCGPARGEWALMRKVKKALDPARVFCRDGAWDRVLRGAAG